MNWGRGVRGCILGVWWYFILPSPLLWRLFRSWFFRTPFFFRFFRPWLFMFFFIWDIISSSFIMFFAIWDIVIVSSTYHYWIIGSSSWPAGAATMIALIVTLHSYSCPLGLAFISIISPILPAHRLIVAATTWEKREFGIIIKQGKVSFTCLRSRRAAQSTCLLAHAFHVLSPIRVIPFAAFIFISLAEPWWYKCLIVRCVCCLSLW